MPLVSQNTSVVSWAFKSSYLRHNFIDNIIFKNRNYIEEVIEDVIDEITDDVTDQSEEQPTEEKTTSDATEESS